MSTRVLARDDQTRLRSKIPIKAKNKVGTLRSAQQFYVHHSLYVRDSTNWEHFEPLNFSAKSFIWILSALRELLTSVVGCLHVDFHACRSGLQSKKKVGHIQGLQSWRDRWKVQPPQRAGRVLSSTPDMAAFTDITTYVKGSCDHGLCSFGSRRSIIFLFSCEKVFNAFPLLASPSTAVHHEESVANQVNHDPKAHCANQRPC